MHEEEMEGRKRTHKRNEYTRVSHEIEGRKRLGDRFSARAPKLTDA